MSSQLSLVFANLQEVAQKLSLSSIVSFAPKIGKLLVCVLFVLNVRSWPLVWHFRVFRPVFQAKLRHRWVTFRGFFLSPAARIKFEDEWIDSLAPIGSDPFTSVVPYRSWASLDDSDFNGHLSNSSYAKILDGARFKAAMAMFPMFLRAGGWIPLAGTNFSFVREIPILTSYEIRTSIAAWDHKWVDVKLRSQFRINSYPLPKIYVMSRFVRKPDGKKKRVDVKTSSSPANGEISMQTMPLRTPGSELVSSSVTPIGSETPNVFIGPNAPDTNTPLTLNAVTAGLAGEEPDGAILHTVVISQCCFKAGRITVPPSIVLGVNGFTGESGVSHASPHPEWEKVKEIMSKPIGGSTKKLRKFLEGGWRDVPEGERWWEQTLGGAIEERRAKNLALVELLKNGLENVRNLTI